MGRSQRNSQSSRTRASRGSSTDTVLPGYPEHDGPNLHGTLSCQTPSRISPRLTLQTRPSGRLLSLDATRLERQSNMHHSVGAYMWATVFVHPSFLFELDPPDLAAIAARILQPMQVTPQPLSVARSFPLPPGTSRLLTYLVNLPQSGRVASHAVFSAAQSEGDPWATEGLDTHPRHRATVHLEAKRDQVSDHGIPLRPSHGFPSSSHASPAHDETSARPSTHPQRAHDHLDPSLGHDSWTADHSKSTHDPPSAHLGCPVERRVGLVTLPPSTRTGTDRPRSLIHVRPPGHLPIPDSVPRFLSARPATSYAVAASAAAADPPQHPSRQNQSSTASSSHSDGHDHVSQGFFVKQGQPPETHQSGPSIEHHGRHVDRPDHRDRSLDDMYCVHQDPRRDSQSQPTCTPPTPHDLPYRSRYDMPPSFSLFADVPSTFHRPAAIAVGGS